MKSRQTIKLDTCDFEIYVEDDNTVEVVISGDDEVQGDILSDDQFEQLVNAFNYAKQVKLLKPKTNGLEEENKRLVSRVQALEEAWNELADHPSPIVKKALRNVMWQEPEGGWEDIDGN